MKYARTCDITGEGMNSGWCWGDGGFYSSTQENTVAELRGDILSGAYDFGEISKEDLLNKTDDDLLRWAVDEDILYWTIWEDEEEEN